LGDNWIEGGIILKLIWHEDVNWIELDQDRSNDWLLW